MVEMVQEPNAGLTGILLEGNGIAVHDLDILIIDVPLIMWGIPSRAPTTLLLRCLRLTLLKWSTIERRTSGWMLDCVIVALLIQKYFKKC
jgi:hypothetical protein